VVKLGADEWLNAIHIQWIEGAKEQKRPILASLKWRAGRRGGPDVPFILSKIAILNTIK